MPPIVNNDGNEIASAAGAAAARSHKPFVFSGPKPAHAQAEKHETHQKIGLIRLGLAGVADKRL